MSRTSRVLLFGDAPVEKLTCIRDLYRSASKQSLLRSLLRNATDVVQCHLSSMNVDEREAFGDFDDLLELAERNASRDEPEEAVEYVLLTVSQLGNLLCLVEQDPSWTTPTVTNLEIRPFGVCVGLLSAAAAVSAEDASQILKLSAQIVAIALRLALALRRRAQSIAYTSASWGLTLFEVDNDFVQSALSTYNQSFAKSQHAYVGVTSPRWITIFAPPKHLDTLSSTTFQEIAQRRLRSAFPVHASHLPPIDMNYVLGDSSVLNNTSVRRSLMSSRNGTPFVATSLSDLLRSVLNEIASTPIHLSKSINCLVSIGEASQSISVVPVTPTAYTSMLQRTLRDQGVTIVQSAQKESKSHREEFRAGSDLIALVGMSGRFPGAESIEEFWSLLKAGIDMHEEIPESRFNIDNFYDPTGERKNSLLAKYGCFIKNPGYFDNRFFNISPREAVQMDPTQRLLLMTTYEALEMAGYSNERPSLSSNPSKTGVFIGQTTDDWTMVNQQEGADAHYVPSTIRAFAPGRLSHFFKWSGAFCSVDTACSSTMSALHLACQALLLRENDMTIVGGGSILAATEMYSGLGRGGFLSPTGNCKTFGVDADGYCRGEGIGVVVLKRLEDAVRENDSILGVIRGTARNSNAGVSSITQPSRIAQESLFEQLLRRSNLHPHDVSYIEMHGTGTQAGDTAEVASVLKAFATDREPTNPLYLGAAKAAIGHGEAAAGVTSLIKALLMLRHRQIPPQPGYPFELNPKLGALNESNVYIADGTSSLPSDAKIVINSFDAAGGNVSVVLEDGPDVLNDQADNRSNHVIAFSAHTVTSHNAYKERLRSYLKNTANVKLADIAYTTTARRMHHNNVRKAYVVSSVQELIDQLAPGHGGQTQPRGDTPKGLVWTFTGQASQYTGMGQELYETSHTFRDSVHYLQSLADCEAMPNFVDIICGRKKIDTASAAQTQLAITALEISLTQYWSSLGLEPCLVIGHSLGEYPALVAAGVLSVSAALFLVHERAKLMDEYCVAGTYAMLAISAPESSILEAIHSYPSCEISCLNGASNVVVSGSKEELRELQLVFEKRDVGTRFLETSHAFHSGQMQPILSPFETAASKVEFAPPRIAVASTLLGSVILPGSDAIFNAEYLKRQMRERVDFTGAVAASRRAGLLHQDSLVLEIGPHPVNNILIAATTPSTEKSPCLVSTINRKQKNWATISGCLAKAYEAGITIDWKQYHADHIDNLCVLSDLPTYVYDVKDYWITYQGRPEVTSQNPGTGERPVTKDLLSTALQRLESLDRQPGVINASFVSRVDESNLLDAIRGHVVDEAAICPASMFCEMAFSATCYVANESGQGGVITVSDMSITGLEMVHPLVVHDQNTDQAVRIFAGLDIENQLANVRFVLTSPLKEVGLGNCTLKIDPGLPFCRTSWSMSHRLIKARVQNLMEAAKNHQMTGPLIYKLFATLVDYSSAYHAIQSIHISEGYDEAAASIALVNNTTLGTFTQNPFATDSIVHFAGFLLNTNPAMTKNEIHIANSIGSLSIVGKLTSEPRVYTAYAAIREQSLRGSSICDVHIYDEKDLFAICTGIKFQKVTRELFDMMMGKDRSSAVRSSTMARSPTTPSVRSESPSSNTSVGMHDLFGQLWESIAAKSGLDLEDMSMSNTFSDMGLDSQMSIMFIDDFKQRTSIELPASFFLNFPTLESAREELSGPSKQSALPVDQPKRTIRRSDTDSELRVHSVPYGQGDGIHPGPSASEQLLSILALELGLALPELTSDAVFHSLGVDSLIGINVLSRFKKSTGRELPAAFFNNHPTVGEVQKALDGLASSSSNRKLQGNSAANLSGSASSMKRYDSLSMHQLSRPNNLANSHGQRLESRAVLIQGNSSSTEPPLFLATDGSGAVTPYIHFPVLADGRRIYALESPFLECPEDYTISIQEMAAIFIEAIVKIQPLGPYTVGGWSAGGVYAYEIAFQLAAAGNRIKGLIFMDTRVNHSIPGARVTMDFIEEFGLFAGVNRSTLMDGISRNQKMHLASTVGALVRYDPIRFPEDRQPDRTFVIWASKGLNESNNVDEHNTNFKEAAAMRPRHFGENLSDIPLEDFERDFKSWFFGTRKDFGTNGWETLLGDRITVHVVSADHFSMVVPPQIKDLGSLVLGAMSELAIEDRY